MLLVLANRHMQYVACLKRGCDILQYLRDLTCIDPFLVLALLFAFVQLFRVN
jgi:hypothetical protein